MVPDPYARIGAAYAAEFANAEADLPGYERRRVGERVLVLGCGTGRVSHHLRAREVVGLDRSEDMLAVARRGARAGETYVHGDMTSFRLGPFSDVLAPNAAFAFLPDRTARADCLAACRAALPAGGPLTLDLPMPDHRLWAERHHPERPAWEGNVKGRHTWRTRETFRDPVAQTLRLVDRYRDDTGWTAESVLVLHLFSVDEVHWMLEANGFYVEDAWGDYDEGPLRPGCPRLLVRAMVL
jgi:trans-aconitate methyltransferase